MQIILSKGQKEELVNHAKKTSPSESCALLFGKMNSDVCTVSEIFLAKNTDDSPANFTISNEELLKGYKVAEEKKLDVIGIFHSHPNSDAIPSYTDREFMQLNPVVWVIFSNRFDDMKAFLFDNELSMVDVKILN